MFVISEVGGRPVFLLVFSFLWRNVDLRSVFGVYIIMIRIVLCLDNNCAFYMADFTVCFANSPALFLCFFVRIKNVYLRYYYYDEYYT